MDNKLTLLITVNRIYIYSFKEPYKGFLSKNFYYLII